MLSDTRSDLEDRAVEVESCCCCCDGDEHIDSAGWRSQHVVVAVVTAHTRMYGTYRPFPCASPFRLVVESLTVL